MKSCFVVTGMLGKNKTILGSTFNYKVAEGLVRKYKNYNNLKDVKIYTCNHYGDFLIDDNVDVVAIAEVKNKEVGKEFVWQTIYLVGKSSPMYIISESDYGKTLDEILKSATYYDEVSSIDEALKFVDEFFCEYEIIRLHTSSL